MEDQSIPAARPVPADTVVDSVHIRKWARGATWVAAGIALTVIAWWVTGVDILYAVIVAFVALGALDGRLTVRRALTHLAFAAGLVMVGALVFGRLGIGESSPSRIVLGAVGLAASALILLVVVIVRRARSRPAMQIER